MIILTPSSARQCPSRAGASGPGTERVGASESARRRAMLHAWKLEMGRRGSRHGGKGSRRMLDRHCGRGRVNHARRRDRSLAGRGRTGVSFAIVFSAFSGPLFDQAAQPRSVQVRPGRAAAHWSRQSISDSGTAHLDHSPEKRGEWSIGEWSHRAHRSKGPEGAVTVTVTVLAAAT